jgi:murein L,D-transpeptidase YafK
MKGKCPNRGKKPGNKIICSMLVMLALLPSCNNKDNAIHAAFMNFTGRHVIYITKKNFLLEVYNRKAVAVASFPIAFGSNPDRMPKLFEGDNRTPEGIYYINEILSMDADKKTASYGKLKNLNKVYFSARKGHGRFGEPGVDLGDNVYGPRYFGLNYPNGEDRVRYRKAQNEGTVKPVNGKMPGIGYGIAIHGNNDEKSIGHLSSNGCIRMYNRDVVEFEQYIQLGTPVIISPD